MYKKGYKLFIHGDSEGAIAALEPLVAQKPNESGPYVILASALVRLKRYEEARKVVDLGFEKQKKDPDLYMMRIEVLANAGDMREAMEVGSEAVDLFPDHQHLAMNFSALACRGGSDFFLKGTQVAEKILEKDPENVEALNNIGSALLAINKPLEAAKYFTKALRVKPDHINALLNLAAAFEKLYEHEKALAFHKSILGFEPENGLAMCSIASINSKHGLSAENIPLFEKGLAALKAVNNMDGWTVYASNLVFFSHYAPDLPREKIRGYIDDWYNFVCAGVEQKPRVTFNNTPDLKRKLKVALLSNSFKQHPVTWMTSAALKNIDRDQFEIKCYSNMEPSRADIITRAYYDLCDSVTEVYEKSDEELLRLLREDEIDILLELTGHSEGGKRLVVSAHRAAPVQVKWVGGLFDTTGVPAIDWILGDDTQIPEGDEKWYTERVYRMPDDYIVYDPPNYAGEVQALPALKNGYVTFANMNNLAKTNTYSIALWSKILKAVPKSRILMKFPNMDTPFAKKYLEEEFAKHGIGVDRLIIEGGVGHVDFIKYYNTIDIALDPHPYTGGLTTCEALWMGVPVVTLPGETFAGLHAATHLHNAGMDEWIAKNEQDYIDIAVKWANDLEGLSKLRAGLREQVKASPLTDGPKFAKNLEKALRFMWKDWCDEKDKHEKGKK